MFLSILTPLDRTSFAEQSLPLAAGIARRANAKLDLVEVHSLYALEAPSAGWIPFDTESDDECRQQEQLYLDATAKRVTLMSEIPVTTGVLAGCVVLPKMIADSILERAKSDKTDLIVMVTHGHGQVNRAVGGSVADELVRRASIPVLLVRPGEKANDIIPEPVIDNILIALDGSPLAEQVLDPAFDLARLMEATCKLIRVVPPESSQGDLKSGMHPRGKRRRSTWSGLPTGSERRAWKPRRTFSRPGTLLMPSSRRLRLRPIASSLCPLAVEADSNGSCSAASPINSSAPLNYRFWFTARPARNLDNALQIWPPITRLVC